MHFWKFQKKVYMNRCSAIQLLEYQMVWALCRFDLILWCVTGALCVSGATSTADSTHQAPVILIQMGGA